MSLDGFWSAIDAQIAELESAVTADRVCEILSAARNPYGDGIVADGFFGGGGGDKTVRAALRKAGWVTVWAEAWYHYEMRAPDGSAIRYVEGDIYKKPGSDAEPKVAGYATQGPS